MNITYWTNFSKRKNSTKQPVGGTTVANVALKEETSIENPTFVIQGDLFGVTYVQAFGNYYFVEDVQSIRSGITQIKCKMDPMATHKSDIGAYTAFIERAATAYDTMIADPMVAIKNSVTKWQSNGANSSTEVPGIFDTEGTIIISVLNNKGSGAGFTCYYAIGVAALQRLAGYCNQNPADTPSITQIVEWLQATFLKTADAVIDCMWIPIAFSVIQNLGSSIVSGEQLVIGKDAVTESGTAVNGYRFLKAHTVTSTPISITLSHRYTDFRKAQPYTRGQMNLPFYGMWEFNPLDITDDIINVAYAVDLTSGECLIYITSNSKTVATLKINVGFTVPVGKVGNQIASGLAQAIPATALAIGGIAAKTTAGVLTGASAAATAVNGYAQAALGISPSVHGSLTGRVMAAVYKAVFVILTFSDTADPSDLTADNGRPLMDRRQISTLSGYIKCSDASIEIAGFDSDRAEINGYLNSGFYYE